MSCRSIQLYLSQKRFSVCRDQELTLNLYLRGKECNKKKSWIQVTMLEVAISEQKTFNYTTQAILFTPSKDTEQNRFHL